MCEIKQKEPTEEFDRCWNAAGKHLQSQTHDGNLSWLKATLTPPFLEHLSFRLSNQLFFIRVEDADGNACGPGNPDGFRTVAEGCEGHACRMPMRFNGAKWETTESGWGLVDDKTGRIINPIEMISDQKIEMTRWEVHGFAVQVVRDYIKDKLGCDQISAQGNPDLDPAIWFARNGASRWVVIRAVKYPESKASPPENIADIAACCFRKSKIGYFASVAVANADDPFDSKFPPLPLWRGHGMYVSFQGLQEITHDARIKPPV